MLIVIGADGALTEHVEPATIDRVRELVGPGGWAMVRVADRYGMVAWVNGIGLVKPEPLPRNPVGACVLAALGAPTRAYAGPVVFTGLDPNPESGYPTDLDDRQRRVVVELHEVVTAALSGGPLRSVPTVPAGFHPDLLREYADHVNTAGPFDMPWGLDPAL